MLAHAGLGEREDALGRLGTLRQKTRHDVFAVDGRRMYMAIAYTLLGERDEAVRLLEEDVTGTGLTTLHGLELPLWDPLRDHPGFRALAQARE